MSDPRVLICNYPLDLLLNSLSLVFRQKSVSWEAIPLSSGKKKPPSDISETGLLFDNLSLNA